MKGTEDGNAGPELIYASRVLGVYLKVARQRAGFSLRELEKRSGVSDSEIFKVESGAQDCRLESFVRICAALGVPWGDALDNVVSANFEPYFNKIVDSQVMRRLVPKDYDPVRRPISVNVAMIAAFAAHLVRCSRPAARAKAMEYPADEIAAAFLRFAETLESGYESIERLSILAALADDPILEMSRLGLFGAETGAVLLDAMLSENPKQNMGPRLETISGEKLGSPVRTPFLPSEVFLRAAQEPLRQDLVSTRPDDGDVDEKLRVKENVEHMIKAANMGYEGKKELTKHSEVRNVGYMKSPMKDLLARLAQATKARGKKAALAKFLKIPASRISEWLHGSYEPSGEITLRLLEWVRAGEAAQQKTPGDVTTAAKGKTRSTQSKYEKRKTSPRQE